MPQPLDADADADPKLVAALAEVQRTFDNMRAANTKVARSSKPASLAAARRAANLAERAYREAADRRDELVQIRNARMTQRGDERGALWSAPDGVTAPVVKLAGICDYRYDHDANTDRPTGPQCTSPATHRIFWEDGRFSLGCAAHLAIDLAATVKPASVVPLPHVVVDERTNEVGRRMGQRPVINLPNAELQRAVDALREAGVVFATVRLSDGRALIFRGGPFGSVEITP